MRQLQLTTSSLTKTIGLSNHKIAFEKRRKHNIFYKTIETTAFQQYLLQSKNIAVRIEIKLIAYNKLVSFFQKKKI